MKVDGRCHCGQVSFTALIDPAKVFVCHCTDCQTLSGAPFRAVAPTLPGTLEVQGETRAYIKVAESGNRRAQVFCPTCATPLFAGPPEGGPMAVLRLGCVRQRAELVPSLQIWQHSAMPWLGELAQVPAAPKAA